MFARKFFGNTKGAVTVFVSLLLIPAILVSGTAVDLARIHTARSVVQDANQLAGNSVLTQYDALLYDIYGLFGIAEDDPILWELLNDYVSVSVFGEPSQDRGLGTLQVFYGADLAMDEVHFANDKDLSSTDVLRHQIEEYMKFRGPVIIVKEFLDALDDNTIKADTEVMQDKLSIDAGIADLYEKYKKLYDAINVADKCTQAIGGAGGGYFGSISTLLGNIRSDFVSLRSAYNKWRNADCEDEKDEHSRHYRGILENIGIRVVGGRLKQNWQSGRRNAEGDWVGGAGWRNTSSAIVGLNRTVENTIAKAEEFKPNFNAVVNYSREIDTVRDQLMRDLDELERKLNSGEANEELVEAFLVEKHGSPPLTLIESYREALKWDNLGGMAARYKDVGYDYIDNVFIPMLEGVKYRNRNNESAGSLTREELARLSSDSRFALSGGSANSQTTRYSGFPSDSVNYAYPPGFLRYSQITNRHREFFADLTAMMNQPQLNPVKLYNGQQDEGGADAEEKQENIIDALLKLIDTAYEGLANEPLGARYIEDDETPEAESLGILEIVETIAEALGSNVVDVIQDPAGGLMNTWEYLLTLTYCTSVFSNYTTARPESIGKTRDYLEGVSFPKTMTGVSLSPKVNYFFQSEWEYLYEGKNSAGSNLGAITELLFMVRLVCNYLVVFSVTEITMIVNAIKAAFAWAPPLGIVLGELARAAFVAAESLFDVGLLRSGYKVPLRKSVRTGEWICSPSGIINAIGKLSNSQVEGMYDSGLTYSNYTLFFFIAKALFSRDAGAELAERAGNLIEWNIINYRNDVFSDEEKMAEALEREDRFRLSEMKTDFSITTTANMRMLFLSMIYAQNFADRRGITAPATMPISVTDYRGY